MADYPAWWTNRQLLDLILTTLEQMGNRMSAAEDYVKAALDSLDVQMRDLQTRLQSDAAALAAAVANANLAAADEAALTAAADRVQATAVVVAGLAQPTAVADPGTGDTATPIDPGDGSTPPADGSGDTGGGVDTNPPADGGTGDVPVTP